LSTSGFVDVGLFSQMSAVAHGVGDINAVVAVLQQVIILFPTW